MSEEELLFECSECGKKFPPDPDSIHEVEMGSILMPESVAQEEVEKGNAMSIEEAKKLTDEDLKQMDMSRDDLNKIIRGEDVAVGGVCICPECMDNLSKEQP